MRSYGLALLTGVLLVFSFPHYDLSFLAYGALVPLLVALDGVPPLQAAYLGTVAGLACYLGSIPWVVHTMSTYGRLPLPVSLLLLLALSLYLALYVGVFAYGMARWHGAGDLSYLLGAAFLWVALEYLRTFLLTGFPWNLLGYTQYRNLPMIQIASITGVYGVSFLVVLVNAAVALAYLRFHEGWGRALFPSVGASLLLFGSSLFGAERMASLERQQAEIPVAIVQGNIEQEVKWDLALQAQTLEKYRRLTRQAASGKPHLIVWPETALPFFFREGGPLSRQVLDLAVETQSHLVVGAPDRTTGDRPRYYNSAFLVSPGGEIVGKYDKMHLVPFGEYVPLSSILFFVEKLAHGIGDFSAGESYTVFSTSKGAFGVSICFEVIFPAQVRRHVSAGADFLVNITNDAWFGRSSAPFQHLSMAAFRAVENGVYLVRAANTGVSALVAPSGAIVTQSALFVEAVLTGAVHRGIGGTFYTRYGDLFAWGCLLGAGAFLVFPGGGKQRRGGKAW